MFFNNFLPIFLKTVKMSVRSSILAENISIINSIKPVALLWTMIVLAFFSGVNPEFSGDLNIQACVYLFARGSA